MALPEPLTTKIANLSVDTTALAEQIDCPDLRREIAGNLRRLNGKIDILHNARLIARGLEDTGEITAWQYRKLREIELLAERTGELEAIERRPLPAAVEAD